MANLVNFSFVSLLICAQAFLVLSANIKNATDFDSGFPSDGSLTKRSTCRDQRVDFAQRSYCTLADVPDEPADNMEFLRFGKRWGEPISDIPLRQNFHSTHFAPKNIDGYQKVRACRDFKIDQSGDYIIYIRCDPNYDWEDGMALIVNRNHTKWYRTKLGCMTIGNRISTSQIALNLCQGDILETTFVTIIGQATEVLIVPFKETETCGFDINNVHPIYKRYSSPRRDITNKQYDLDYQSKPLFSPDNIVKRGENRRCRRFLLSNTGVYWIMFTVNGIRGGGRHIAILERDHGTITLFDVNPMNFYQSRALAVFAPSNSFITVESDTIGCDSDSTSKYQVSAAYLGYNQFRRGYAYGSYEVCDHYTINLSDYISFQEYFDRFFIESDNAITVSIRQNRFKETGFGTFMAPEPGRYIVSLSVKSRHNLTFKLVYWDDCQNNWLTFHAAFFFEHLPNTQNHIAYMKAGGRIRIRLTDNYMHPYDRTVAENSDIGVGSTFSIAYVHPL